MDPEFRLPLLPQHAALLRSSGITPEVAQGRGYVSVDTKATLARFGFGRSARQVPGLLVPIYNVMGKVAFHQYRPDSPRLNTDGKPIKYETPANVRMALDVHPLARASITDPSRLLFITEGIRKADAAVSQGLCCVALLGVWNWRGRNEKGGLTALTDWESIALNGRRVYVVFDSDVMVKGEVHQALERLAAFLRARGAHVAFCYLPSGVGGAKVGLDDFLAAGRIVDDLLVFATTELRRPPEPEVKERSLALYGSPPETAALLADVAAFIRRYVVLTDAQVMAVALWVLHTWAIEAADVTPYLIITSPEKRTGKTRLLEVLDLLVPRAMRVANTSTSALFRTLDDTTGGRVTLLQDEADALFH